MTKEQQKIEKMQQELNALQEQLDNTPTKKHWWIRLAIEILRIALVALGVITVQG